MQALKRSILAIAAVLAGVGALAFLVPAFAEAAPAETTTQPGIATSTLHANVHARVEWAHARHAWKHAKDRANASTTPIIQGNGEPVIGGVVSAISSSTLTVTTKSGIAYTVNASGATVVKDHATSTLSRVTQGDAVIVQGTMNGTSVTASSVIDSSAVPASEHGIMSAVHRFFGGVRGFFARLFGFF